MKRYVIAVGLVLLPFMLFSCGGAGKTDQTATDEGVLIVANKSGDDIYFIDPGTGETLLILPTERGPHEVEVSDDGRIAVVSNYGDSEQAGNTLSVYDIEEGKLLHLIDLGEHTRPHGMQWIDGTSTLLVTAEGSRHLLHVDAMKADILNAFYTDQPVSHMVASSPCFHRAFVPSIRTGNVSVIDLESGKLLAQVYSGAGAEGIAVHPELLEVWVTNRAENTISIIDVYSLEVLASIPCLDFPIRATFTPDGNYFLVSNAQSGEISVFDSRSRVQLSSIKLTAPLPEGVDKSRYFSEFEGTSVPIGLVAPDNEKAYVANTRSDVISIIDLKTMTIKGHLPAGREPDGINFSRLRPKQQ